LKGDPYVYQGGRGIGKRTLCPRPRLLIESGRGCEHPRKKRETRSMTIDLGKKARFRDFGTQKPIRTIEATSKE